MLLVVQPRFAGYTATYGAKPYHVYTIKLYYQLTHHTISMPYYLLYWRISEQLCCCWCGRQGCGDVEQEVASRGRHGGQKPTSNSDATNNNCQTIIFLVGDHFSERKFIVECLCFLYRFMFMVDMRRCGKPQMNEWFKEIDGLGYFHRVKLINSATSSKNLLIEPLIS